MLSRILTTVFLTLSVLQADSQPPAHNYDLQHVQWHIAFDEPIGGITGRAINRLKLLADGTTQVWLHSEKLNVTYVKVNGSPAKFKVEGGRLVVSLHRTGSKNQMIEIETVYTGTPEAGVYFVSPQSAYPSKTGMIYTQGQGEDTRYWLPTYDYPDDKATSEGFIEVPKAYSTIGNGLLVGSEEKGDKRIDHWKMDQPHSTYLISFIVGPYSEDVKYWRNVPVSYHVPPGLEANGEISFGRTPEMIELFSRITGTPYPYPRFAQSIVGDFVFGGMENITAVTNTSRTLHPKTNQPLESSDGLVLHELAHQWFGDLVTCRTWDDMWVNEGWATFLPNFWVRERVGKDDYDYGRYGTFQNALGSFKGQNLRRATVIGTDPVPTSLGNPYPGGSARMFMLMDQMGERTFWNGVRDYLKEYGFKSVTTAQFFDAMGRSSGKNLTPFMNQHFRTHATPDITASYSGRDLVLTQPKPYYKLDVSVWIWTGRNWVKRVMHLNGPEARLDASVNFGKPVLIDPEVHLMVNVSTMIPMTTEEIEAMYRHAPNVASKARIIDLWFDKLPQSTIATLASEERFWGLTSKLTERLTNESAATLTELLKHSDVRVVDSAIKALAKVQKNDAIQLGLQEIFQQNANAVLRQSALDALLILNQSPGLAEDAWITDSFNDGFRIRAMQFWVKHDPNLARNRALANLAKPGSEPLRYACIEALGAVRDLPGDRAAFDALVKVLGERSYRARLIAIQALGAYGDKAAIPVLEPFLTHGQNGLRGTATAAVEQLKKK